MKEDRSSIGIRPESLQVLTEREINSIIDIGVIYRPAIYSILLIREGTIHFRHNLAEHTLGKNTLLFVIPNSVYEFINISIDAQLISIAFTREFLEQSSIYLGGTNVVSYFSSGVQPFYPLMEGDETVLLGLLHSLKLKVESDSSLPYFLQVAYFLSLAIMHEAAAIYRKYNSEYSRKLSRKQEITVGFFQLLSLYCKEERSVQFYADSLFVSSKHLTEVLKSLTGKKAGELIDQAVILESKILLRNPALNISQAADALHFSDQFFFSKFFKKHTGLTPSQFRARV